MTTHAYTEDQLVEQPAIGLFAELGWQTLSAMEEILGSDGTLGRETKREMAQETGWSYLCRWWACVVSCTFTTTSYLSRKRNLWPSGWGRYVLYRRWLSA